MKMIKKLLVAVLAMAMVLGAMAVSTFAAEKRDVTVTVEWDGAEGDVCVWLWGAGDLALNYCENGWPGDAATKNDDGTYTVTIKDVMEDTVKVIANVTDADGATVQTVDSDAVDATKGGVKIVVGEEGDDGKFAVASIEAYEVAADAPAEDTPAGDSTAVMGYVVAAVVALAAVVTVISKKRSVEA